MKQWWHQDFARVARELSCVEQLQAEGWLSGIKWRSDNERLSLDATITAQGAEYAVRLIYPAQFPLVPAWVEPQDPGAHWSVHQYGKGGVLCLELRPDNWEPSATGADVVRSAYNLLRTENPRGEGAAGVVASAHQMTRFQQYGAIQQPVLVGAGCVGRLFAGESKDVQGICWVAEDTTFPILVFDAQDLEGERRPPDANFWASLFKVRTVAVRGEVVSPLPTIRRDLVEHYEVHDLLEDLPDDERLLILLLTSSGEIVPLYSVNATNTARRDLLVLPDDAGKRSGAQATGEKRLVAIVGMGSVGSKIAESILRSVHVDLLLVDGDVMLPGNLERHSLDWRDVGFRKVKAMKRRLTNIRPGTDIFTYTTNLDWQQSAKRYGAILDLMALADLIVDATAHAPTSLLLGAVAAINERPFLSVEVFEGGIGCLVARAVPALDEAYAHALPRFLAYCNEQSVQPPTPSSRDYESLDEDGEPMIADDASVGVAASYAARIALDILAGDVEPNSPSWLLIGLRRAWLFSGVGHVIGLEMRPEKHERPDATPDDQESLRRAHELVDVLISESEDARASPT